MTSKTKQVETAAEVKELGNKLFKEGKFQEAINAYSRCLKLDTTNTSKHVYLSNRAACYLALGQADKAALDAEDCIEHNNRFTKGYLRLAAALSALSRFQKAYNALLVAQSLEPNNSEIQKLLEQTKVQLQAQKAAEKMASNPETANESAKGPETDVAVLAAGDPSLLQMSLEAGIFSKESINSNKNDNKLTALHYAVLFGQEKSVELLLKHGADPNVKCGVGGSPLSYAVGRNPNKKIAKLLINAKADVNSANLFGNSILHAAALIGNQDIIKLLLKHGANPSAINPQGETPLDISTDPAIRQLLEAALTKNVKKQEKHEQGCSFCGKTAPNLKRCTRCYMAQYCGVECQRSHWTQHKLVCKESVIITRVTKYTLPQNANYMTHIGLNWNADKPTYSVGGISKVDKNPMIKYQAGKKVILKVQLGLNGENADMLVYNQDRSYKVAIQASAPHFKEIQKIVRSEPKGMGLKAYLWGEVKDEETLILYTNSCAPWQLW